MLLKKYLEKLDRSYSKHKFRKVSCNSKKIKNGDVFFAIKGHTNNGNLFINDAIKNGAKTKKMNSESELLKWIVKVNFLKKEKS